MDRADLTTYLSVTMADLLTEAGVGDTDIATGLLYPLDQTFARVGSDAPADLVYMALGEYYTLLRIRNVLAARVDFDATAYQRGSRSTVFAQVEVLLDDAASRCAGAGYPVGDEQAKAGGYGFGAIYVDYAEPLPT